MLKRLLVIALSAGSLVTISGCVVAPVSDNHPRQMRDSDRDGIPNRYDRDRDGDGVPNRYDRDRDGDGTRDRNDRRPNNPNRR